MTFRVRQATSIDEIGDARWDALAGEEIFGNSAWLRTLETAQRLPRTPYYWWIEDEQGPAAAVAARLRPPGPPAWNIDWGRYGALAYAIRPLRHLFERRATLVCGGQMAPAQPILARPGLSAETYREMGKHLLTAIESRCRSEGWNLIFRGIVEPDEHLRQIFSGRPYLEGAEWPATVLDIRWDSWPAYLRELKQTHPATEKGARYQVNRGRTSGVTIEEFDDPSALEADLHRILADHHYRKNLDPFYMGPNFLSVLKRNLGDRAVILVARQNGRLLGLAIHLRNRTAVHLKFVGMAADAMRTREAVYFNTTYNEVIRRACEGGFQQLYLGILTYTPKCRRGARLIPVSSWIWHPDRARAALLRPLLKYQAERQERRLRPLAVLNRAQHEVLHPPYRWLYRPPVGD